MRSAAPSFLAILYLAAILAIAPVVRAYEVRTLASGLDKPWSIAEMGDGAFLVTEKTGQLLLLNADGSRLPVAGAPAVYSANQGGLLEVLLHPDFAQNRQIFLSFAGGDKPANRTTVVSGTLSGTRLSQVTTLLEVSPDKEGPAHYGGKMAFLPDGTLLVSVGEGFKYRERAQDLGWELGKLLRINTDGSSPTDNPYPETAPRVFSYGHRNPQGLVFDSANNQILMLEHGPKGGDELNHILAGKNYGWPAITYGVDYSGAVISPFTEADGMEQPLHYWVPSIGPSGLAIYRGDDFPEWQGDLLLGSLINGEMRRLRLDSNKVILEESVFPEVTGRVRDVRVMTDGSIIAITDEGDVFHITN
ncbi:MAG: PQQ-dependent sugar dehydrogenase [Luminiphilus sp.]|nr:PQQ-dependent sugar dehydrogenase [Luminiphilus sp.]